MTSTKQQVISQDQRQLVKSLDAEYFKSKNVSRLNIDNHHGHGCINTYDISSLLSVQTYNIKFKREVRLRLDELSNHAHAFFYCVTGYCYQKFSDENEAIKIGQMQNVIVKNNQKQSELIFPADVPLKLSLLFLKKPEIGAVPSTRNSYLASIINETIGYLNDLPNDRYIGEIDVKTSKFAKELIRNDRFDFIDRLAFKAFVLNALGSQLMSYKINSMHPGLKSPIDSDEIDKIIDLSSYIGNNLEKNLSIASLCERSSLSPKKLQDGFKFIFGETLNNFIKNVRLEHSKQLIQSTDLTISEVCYAIGFNSRSYFSKIFNKRFGMHPSEFKEGFLNDDTIFELSYRSKKSNHIDASEIDKILLEARKNNVQNNITGCLLSYKEYFFQIIEGSKVDILNLLEILKKDTRHYDLCVLHQGAIAKRLFTDFSMAALAKPDDFIININGQIKEVNFREMTSNMTESNIASDIFWMRVSNMLKLGN